jgi:hypothetical protein
MFSSVGLFRDVPCPLTDSCNRPICLFSHNPAAVLSVTQVGPLPVPATSTVVPAKRRAQADPQHDPLQLPSSSSSRQSCPADAERPTKLQRTGPAAKPVAVPTASSSSVSSMGSLHHPGFLTPFFDTPDRCSNPYDQCRAVKDPRFDAPGMSPTSCLLARNVVSACPPPIRVPSALCRVFVHSLHAHTLASPSAHAHQDHVEIAIRPLCHALQRRSSPKSFNSIRSCAPPRARDIRAHQERNISKCDHFPSCSSCSRQSHHLRPLSHPLPLSRGVFLQRPLLIPPLARTGILQPDAKSRVL